MCAIVATIIVVVRNLFGDRKIRPARRYIQNNHANLKVMVTSYISRASGVQSELRARNPPCVACSFLIRIQIRAGNFIVQDFRFR